MKMQAYKGVKSEDYPIINEDAGRFVTCKLLTDYYERIGVNNFSITPTIEQYAYIDLVNEIDYQGKKLKYSIEVKQRYKTEEQILKYPTAELKVDKYNRMLQYSTEINSTGLLYIVLQNKSTAYIYNLSNINMDSLQVMNWRIPTKNYGKSYYKDYPTYLIPYNLASQKIDITKYFTEYDERGNN